MSDTKTKQNEELENGLANSQSNGLGVPNELDAFTIAERIDELKDVAKYLVSSGFLPDKVDSVSKCVSIMLYGREIGLPPMSAFQSIDVIRGNPTTKPRAMIALAEKTGELEDWTLERSEDPEIGSKCVVKRKGRSEKSFEFTLTDANNTKFYDNDEGCMRPLSQKFNWQNNPRQMCDWRAIGHAFRLAFPDVLGGLYTPDEASTIPPDEADEADYEIVDDTDPVEEQTSDIADQASQKANGTNGSADSHQEDTSDGDEEPDAEPEREEQSEEPAETDEEESESAGDDVQKIELMADEFKKETLKHECRERDLKVSGDKFELADRLVSNGVDPQDVTGFYDDETEYADREGDDPGQDPEENASDDSDAESSGGPEVKMFEIMQKTKDLLDQIEDGNFTHVNFTVDKYGQSEDVVSEIVSYLEKCVNGEEDYETDEDDLLPIDV